MGSNGASELGIHIGAKEAAGAGINFVKNLTNFHPYFFNPEYFMNRYEV